MAQKKKLTDEQLILIEGYGAIRLPVEQIAALFDMGKSQLEYILKKSAQARKALEAGRAKASVNARKTLYERAFVEKDPAMMRFWCNTQEGFVHKDALEINGKADVSEMTDKELEARTAKMMARIAARKKKDL